MQCALTEASAAGLRRGLGVGITHRYVQGTLGPLLRGVKTNAIGCNTLEDKDKHAIACRRPDLRLKPIAPYKYGFCREPDVPMRMSCPPKVKKRGRGPCCHEGDDKRKGGCKVRK